MAIRENTTICGSELAEFVIGHIRDYSPEYLEKNDEFEVIDSLLRNIVLDDVTASGDYALLLANHMDEVSIDRLYVGFKRMLMPIVDRALYLSDEREVIGFRIKDNYDIEFYLLEHEIDTISNRDPDEHGDFVPERMRR